MLSNRANYCNGRTEKVGCTGSFAPSYGNFHTYVNKKGATNTSCTTSNQGDWFTFSQEYIDTKLFEISIYNIVFFS